MSTRGVSFSRRRPAEYLRRFSAFKRLPRIRWRPTSEGVISSDARERFPEFSDDFRFLDDTLLPRFQEFDQQALRSQNDYRLQRLSIILGGALASVLGAVQASHESTWAGGAQIVVAGLLSILAVRLRDQSAQSRYLTCRLKAERLRSEYFLFLGRIGEYADEGGRGPSLRRRVAAITTSSKVS